MTRRILVATALLALGASLASCRSRSALPDDYLGRWYFLGTSGGITGGGTGEPAEGWIVITDENEIESYGGDGTLAATEPFEPTRGPSIYSADEAWILVGFGGLDRVIQLYPDGTMALADNAYDGYSRAYRREPPSGG